MHHDTTLGERVAEARESRGLTLEQACAALGQLDDQESVDALLALLRDDHRDGMAAAVCNALGQLKAEGAAAGFQSTPRSRACAWGLRKVAPCSMPGRLRSST